MVLNDAFIKIQQSLTDSKLILSYEMKIYKV